MINFEEGVASETTHETEGVDCEGLAKIVVVSALSKINFRPRISVQESRPSIIGETASTQLQKKSRNKRVER